MSTPISWFYDRIHTYVFFVNNHRNHHQDRAEVKAESQSHYNLIAILGTWDLQIRRGEGTEQAHAYRLERASEYEYVKRMNPQRGYQKSGSRTCNGREKEKW